MTAALPSLKSSERYAVIYYVCFFAISNWGIKER